MSDKLKQDNNEEPDDGPFRELAQQGFQRYALPFAFAALDGALAEYLTTELDFRAIKIFRTPVTTGSVHFSVEINERQAGTLRLRVIKPEPASVTSLSALPGPSHRSLTADDQELAEGLLLWLMEQFVGWFYAEYREAVAASETLQPKEHHEISGQVTIKTISGLYQAKRRGPQPQPHNAWAREQYQLGREIDEILPNYMRLRGENPNDATAQARAREALRKTIERARR